MANINPATLRNRLTSDPRLGSDSAAILAADPLRVWCSRALTGASVGYIVASQGLMDLPGWSTLGFAFAFLLLVVLAFGRLTGIFQFKSLGWIWISGVFIGFSVIRAWPDQGSDWPLTTVFQVSSAFAGGIGVGLALQAGVPFKAIAWAQTITIIANMAAGSFGIGTGAPAEVDEGRYAGLTGNANELALQLILGACLIWLSPRKAGRLASLLAVGAVGYAFVAAGSRKSLFMLPVFSVLACLQLTPIIKRRPRTTIMILATVLLVAVGLAPMILKEGKGMVVIQRALTYQTDSSFQKRLEMTQEGIKLWRSAPILGRGTDAFRRLSFYGMYAHNNYAELLCDVGLVGTLLFYALHGYILFKCLRLPPVLKASCALFVLMLLVIDIGAVSYYRKQSIMILMVLATVANNPRILTGSSKRSDHPSPLGGNTRGTP